jgi:hypothetical protein
MPNWCNNNISIAGPTDTIKQLWEDAHADAGDNTERGLLDAMAPMPNELQGTTAPSDGPNWYDWRVNNWGTKWDISTEGLEFIDNGDGTAEITGWFESAWSPPIGAYEKFCDDMDNCSLEAYYEEGGMCFVGYWDSEGADDHYDYSGATSEDVRNMVPEYLVDEFALDERLAEYEQEEMDEEEVAE